MIIYYTLKYSNGEKFCLIKWKCRQNIVFSTAVLHKLWVPVAVGVKNQEYYCGTEIFVGAEQIEDGLEKQGLSRVLRWKLQNIRVVPLYNHYQVFK